MTTAVSPVHTAATLETIGSAGVRCVACRKTARSATPAQTTRMRSTAVKACQPVNVLPTRPRPYHGRNNDTTRAAAPAVITHSAGRRRRRSMSSLRRCGGRGYACGVQRVAPPPRNRPRAAAAGARGDERGAPARGPEVDVPGQALPEPVDAHVDAR